MKNRQLFFYKPITIFFTILVLISLTINSRGIARGEYHIPGSLQDETSLEKTNFASKPEAARESAVDVFNLIDLTPVWTAEFINGSPLLVDSDDLDNDGMVEIVITTHHTNGGFGNGEVRIYERESHQLEWSKVIDGGYFRITHLAVGQLDNDAAKEILVGGDISNRTRLQVYDGITHELEWSSAELNTISSKALQISNIDSDSIEEIIVGLGNYSVQVFNGASNILQWRSENLERTIIDLSMGNLDGNGIMDLAVLTETSLYVFETNTWTVKLQQTIEYGSAIEIANGDFNGKGELLVATYKYYLENDKSLIQAFDGENYNLLWDHALGTARVNEIIIDDLDGNGTQEIFLTGNETENSNDASVLWIADNNYPDFWLYRMNKNWGDIQNLVLVDTDVDDQKDLLFSSDTLFQLNEVGLTSVIVYRNYLPLVSKMLPKGIFGKVTYRGSPISDIELELRYYDDTSWMTRATTKTDKTGVFEFLQVPGLNQGQYYYVLFGRNSNRADELALWATSRLETYETASDIEIGNFDIANINLKAPPDYQYAAFPCTFQWELRSHSPTDSYEFNIYPQLSSAYFYTYPPLGYVGSYTLNGLPPGFIYRHPTNWYIGIYSPDGGYGVQYGHRVVHFPSPNQSPSVTKDGYEKRIFEERILNQIEEVPEK